MSFKLSVNLSALRQQFRADEKAIERAARPAAQAGAEVVYQEVRRNVARIKRHTGNLASSIYQAYSENNSGDGRATYHISWNARKAPHGSLVEFGHWQRYEVVRDKRGRFLTMKDRPLAKPVRVPGRPFLRPAVAVFPQAEAAMRTRMLEELAAAGVIKA